MPRTTKTPKKRNPNDATFRNITGLRRRIEVLERREKTQRLAMRVLLTELLARLPKH